MTEAEWAKATDPEKMLAWLHEQGRLSDRKARLFAVACCRRIWPLFTDERSRTAVEVAERYADGQVDDVTLASTALAAWSVSVYALGRAAAVAEAAAEVAWVKDAYGGDYHPRLAAHHAASAGGEALYGFQRVVLRDLFGNPFRPPPALAPSLLTWRDGLLVPLAAAAYENRRLPAGTLDPAPLAVLADALEEAGLEDGDVLAHLRQPGGLHVRGCWALDLVLGKA